MLLGKGCGVPEHPQHPEPGEGRLSRPPCLPLPNRVTSAEPHKTSGHLCPWLRGPAQGSGVGPREGLPPTVAGPQQLRGAGGREGRVTGSVKPGPELRSRWAPACSRSLAPRPQPADPSAKRARPVAGEGAAHEAGRGESEPLCSNRPMHGSGGRRRPGEPGQWTAACQRRLTGAHIHTGPRARSPAPLALRGPRSAALSARQPSSPPGSVRPRPAAAARAPRPGPTAASALPAPSRRGKGARPVAQRASDAPGPAPDSRAPGNEGGGTALRNPPPAFPHPGLTLGQRRGRSGQGRAARPGRFHWAPSRARLQPGPGRTAGEGPRGAQASA